MKLKDITLDRIGLRAFLLFIFITPIFFYSGLDMGKGALRIGQEQCYQLGLTALFSICILTNIYLAMAILWIAFQYAYYNFTGMMGGYLINIFFACVLYQVTYNLVDGRVTEKIFKTLLAVGLLNVTYMVVQALGYDFIFLHNIHKTYSTELVGFMGIKCFMGMFFAALIPIAFYFNRLLALSLFVPVYMSEASMAMIGGIAAFLWCMYHHSKKVFVAAVLVLVTAGSVYVAKDSQSNTGLDRINLWVVSLQDAVKHPIIGWGPDSYRNVGEAKPFMYFKNYTTKKSAACMLNMETGRFIPPAGFKDPEDKVDPWDHPHNEYISIFYELGIIPIILLGFMIRDIRRRFRRQDSRQVAIIGFFIAILCFSFAHFPLHVARIGYMIPIMLGIYYKITEREGYR